jgi:hypothetical protein
MANDKDFHDAVKRMFLDLVAPRLEELRGDIQRLIERDAKEWTQRQAEDPKATIFPQKKERQQKQRTP